MKKQKTVMLTITEKCNLNCIYCFEENKSFKTMDLATAMTIIETSFSEANADEEILFDFMGGEPFSEFHLIREICERTWARDWENPYAFYVSTNGTLLDSESKDWLTSNKDRFVCGLSLDGTPDMHNANRSMSYSQIDVRFFKETWPKQSVKMTVSPLTLSSLASGVIYLHELGFAVTCNLAYGPDWSAEELINEYEEQLAVLVDWYKQHPSIRPCSLLAMDLHEVAYPGNELHKWCGMGDQMIAYDIAGIKYPCHYFQGMSSSTLPAEKLWEYDYSRIHLELEENCKNCILRNVCPTCYGNNFVTRGKFGVKEPARCAFKKASALATVAVEYDRLLKKGVNIEDPEHLAEDDSETIRAAWYIQNAALNDDWSLSYANGGVKS